ncbi:MAG TPA: hypothetical protein VFE03_16855 [Caulobacteraceae bacterium]|jgi:hypothetical protein|nr:hypothetical protein [Caulobacteraceae bacterium]
MLKAVIIAAALAAATASVAAPARLSDVQYLKAARCEALITSPALGGGDGAAIKALIKAQRQGRMDYIYDKADQMRAEAASQARRAGEEQKARLVAERDGACRVLLGDTQTAGGASAPHTAN